MTQYYASPTGGGTGLTTASPFKITNFLSKPPLPGDILDLLDGVYFDSIDVNEVSGTGAQKITIRAHNDGGVLLDGQFARNPVRLYKSSHWILEGFNVKNAQGIHVQIVTGSHFNTVRRIVVWDTLWNQNSGFMGANFGSTNNLFEDCAAFGIARKGISFGHTVFGQDGVPGSNNAQNVFRRIWVMMHGCGDDGIGASSLFYNSYGDTFENILTTADFRYGAETFTRTSLGQDVGRGSNGGNFRSFNPSHIMTADRVDGDKCTNCQLLGSLSYLLPNNIARFPDGDGWGTFFPVLFAWGGDCVTIRDVMGYIDPAHEGFFRTPGIALTGPDLAFGTTGSGRSAENITSVGGQGISIHSSWSVADVSSGSSRAAVADPWTTTTAGANLCKRYVNGVKTGDPLWPWPMNERIKAATASAGVYSGPCLGCSGGRAPRIAIDVTADIESILGPIPSECRGTVSTPPPPVTGSGILPPPVSGPHAYYNAYGTFGPNEFGFPAVGASYQDPIFGSSIRRLTNELDQPSSSEIYSKNGFYNATGTVMHHRRADGSHALINPVTGASVRENVTFNVDSSFSPVDPDVWYFFAHGTTELKQFSVGAGTGTTIKTFPGALDKLGGSVDWIDRTGRYMVLKIGGFIRVWDRQTDTLYAGSLPGSLGGGGGWIGISPDGNYVITNTDAAGHADVHSFAINHATQTVSTSGVLCFTLGGGHADVVSASNGKTYLISFDQDESGAVYAVDVTLPQTDANKAQQRSQNRLLVPLNITTDEGHMSGVSKGVLQDWCFISVECGDDEFGDTIEGWRPFMQEILMVNVVTGEVRRLAHHRSRSTSANYFYQPKVSASWDGLIYAWQSNFGYQVFGYADIYAVSTGTSTAPSAPSLPVQTPTPPEDTTIQSPDVRDYQVEVYVNDVLERVEYVTTNRYVYTILMNKTDTPPNGSRTVRFDVRARMRTGTLGQIATVTVTDPPTGMN